MDNIVRRWPFESETMLLSVVITKNSAFLIVMGRVKLLEHECHMNWMTDKWKTKKPLAKFGIKNAIENGFIFKTLNENLHEL